MKKRVKKAGLFFLLPVIALAVAWRSADNWMVYSQELKDDWTIQSSANISVNDQEISGRNFSTQNWLASKVPGSILGSLVADGIYKDIFFNNNLENIPASQFEVPWWYRKVFTVTKLSSGQFANLQFNGINYRADVWLNGQKIASADSIRGGFCRFKLDISKVIREGANVLALKVTPPQKGEPTLGFVDWNPKPADNNMGIWRDVHLLLSGPVSIDQTVVNSKLDTVTFHNAALTVSTLLCNHSDYEQEGELKGMIGKEISFSQKVFLAPHSSKEVVLTPGHFSQLNISNPRVWWVHALGKPSLYNLKLEFMIGKALSDRNTTRFGIRTVSQYITDEGHRGFRLNGKKILIKGGGWTDPMLLDATPEYERAGIDYAVHMNLNAIRMEGFWGGSQHLYDLCDEKGILIMAGISCQWEWEGTLGSPADEFGGIKTQEQMNVATRSWRDQVVWLRNHPSIFLWVYGSDKRPQPELESRYIDTLKKYDMSRPFTCSTAEKKSTITGPSRMKMRGPYDFVPPVYWYVDTLSGGAFGFNTETGPGPQIPVLESLKKMIPADSLWPISSTWMFHSARGKFHNLNYYNNAMDKRLGNAKDLDDYLKKAQFLNYEGMRAMYEAFETNSSRATGIIQWMYNSSWPKLWWQLYDYYLMPTGAFYGARKANEPLHIAFNYGKNTVNLISNTSADEKDLTAEISIFDFGMNSLVKKSISRGLLPAQKTQEIYALPSQMNLSKTWFMDLRLFDKHHKLVSTNFYVLSTQQDVLDQKNRNYYITPQSEYADMTLLQQLPEVKLNMIQKVITKNDTTIVQLTLQNPASHIAFMVNVDMKKKTSGESVLPVFWDDNYFTLLPGEKRIISGYCHTSDLKGENASVVLSGWNVKYHR